MIPRLTLMYEYINTVKCLVINTNNANSKFSEIHTIPYAKPVHCTWCRAHAHERKILPVHVGGFFGVRISFCSRTTVLISVERKRPLAKTLTRRKWCMVNE